MSEIALLALDTATRQATAAVSLGPRVLAQAGGPVTTHSEGLLSLLDGVLRRAGLAVGQLAAVVCGRGPGSFTGLRIGLATAKGLCFAAHKPLVCLSSLLPLGAGAQAWLRGEGLPPDTLCAAVLDARRGEVYCALFRRGEPAGPEQVLSPQDLVSLLAAQDEPVCALGDGALLYRDPLDAGLGQGLLLPPEPCHAIDAGHLCLAALPRVAAGDFDHLRDAVPRYIRSSDARLPGDR